MTEWICFPAGASAVQRGSSDAGFRTRRRPALALTDPQLVFRRSPSGQDQQIPSGIKQLLQCQHRYDARSLHLHQYAAIINSENSTDKPGLR